MIKYVYGVGVNDAGCTVTGNVRTETGQIKRWVCPFYSTWQSMLERGYSVKFKERHPTYHDVSVCAEWHLFSTFKAWMKSQPYEGLQLDKDILVVGNKIYSPNTCVFVSHMVNSFVVEGTASRGTYKIGVNWHSGKKHFVAQCTNPFTSKQKTLGIYKTEEAAHQAWLARKLEHAEALAAIQSDQRVAAALINRYKNYKPQEKQDVTQRD